MSACLHVHNPPSPHVHGLLTSSCLRVATPPVGVADMKTVAIVCQKGGAGKTTVAVHLATAAAAAGYAAALIDLDPQGTAASWGDRRQADAPEVVSGQAPDCRC